MGTAEMARQQGVASLYTDHHGWLQNWLHRKLGNACDAADLAHDTFVRVMASRRLPSQMGDEPRALLTHIAKGLLTDHWRHKEVESAYRAVMAQVPAAEAPSPESSLLVIEALVRVDAMLASLPDNTREMFLMAQLDGLTLKQIGERMRMPVITVRRHLHRALVACMSLA